MSSEQAAAGQGEPPQIFGAVAEHLTRQSRDVSRGWQEAAEAQGAQGAQGRAGHVPPLRQDTEISKTTLAERFQQRLTEARSKPAEDG